MLVASFVFIQLWQPFPERATKYPSAPRYTIWSYFSFVWLILLALKFDGKIENYDFGKLTTLVNFWLTGSSVWWNVYGFTVQGFMKMINVLKYKWKIEVKILVMHTLSINIFFLVLNKMFKPFFNYRRLLVFMFLCDDKILQQ